MFTNDIDASSLFEGLGLQEASTEKKEKIMEVALQTVELRVFEKILSGLDKQKAAECMTIIEGEQSEALGVFLEKENIVLSEIIDKEVSQVKQELSASTTQEKS